MKTENSDLMRAAKISLKGRWGLVIGAMLVFFIINIGVSYLPKVGLISEYIIGGPFALGWAGFILAVSRDQSAKLSQIFQGFNNFGTAFLAYFLSGLFIVLWSLLLIVPGVIAGLSYSLTFYVLADDNSIGARDAIAKSKKMMYGYKWQAFRLGLRFLALSLLGILTLGIGFIWLLPYMYVGWAKFYEHVKSNFVEVESVDTQHQGALNNPIKAPLKKVGYFVRHWRGDLSLAQSFWVNTMLVNIGIGIVSNSGVSSQLTNLLSVATYIVLFWSIALALNTWQFVGVWRSATKHNVSALGYIAKGLIILFTVGSAVGLYHGVFPQVREAFRMVSGDSQIEDFKVTVLPSGKAVEFYGGLKLGASKRLREVLDSAPYVTLIHLETLGGRFGEALEMAKIVKERNLSTYVPRICASAGVFVFLAGKERTAKNGAKIGFHSGTFAGQKFKEGYTIFEKILKDAGVRNDFITQVTSSTEMVYPSLVELSRENIVTKTTKGEGFSLGTHELAENTLENFRKSMLGEGVPKNSAEAVKWYRMAAEQGYANAQFMLGVMYANGDGVPKDFAEAGTWCRKAAEQGYANAQFMLGNMHQSGDGVPKNSGEAVKWYRLAAEQGYVAAQLNLGYMYDIGNGVTKDGAEAEKWYLKAADAGLAIAQANLGELYWIGSSVPKNEDEAIKWFRRAAEQGYSKWQLSVARNYFEGQSTQKNLLLAFAWSKFAAEQGDEDAKMQLAAIEKEINFQQKAEAEKLVRELYNKLPTKAFDATKVNPNIM